MIVRLIKFACIFSFFRTLKHGREIYQLRVRSLDGMAFATLFTTKTSVPLSGRERERNMKFILLSIPDGKCTSVCHRRCVGSVERQNYTYGHQPHPEQPELVAQQGQSARNFGRRAPQTVVVRRTRPKDFGRREKRRRFVGRLSRASAITWCNDSAASAS